MPTDKPNLNMLEPDARTKYNLRPKRQVPWLKLFLVLPVAARDNAVHWV